MNEDVQIVIPRRSRQALPLFLEMLTQQLIERGEASAGGFLGGTFGYGVRFENDVFMMHPFCWCDRAACPWCLACECGESECRNCAGNPIDTARHGGTTNNRQAPNFWHKPSGMRVRWYKYIGRGMEVENDAPSRVVFESVFASLGTTTDRVLVEFRAAVARVERELQEAATYWASEDGRKQMDEMLNDGTIRVVTFGGDGQEHDS